MFVRFEPWEQTDRKRSYDFIQPVKMPSLERKTRFEDINNEVESGYDEEKASEESKRCYLCNLRYDIDTHSTTHFAYAPRQFADIQKYKLLNGSPYAQAPQK